MNHFLLIRMEITPAYLLIRKESILFAELENLILCNLLIHSQINFCAASSIREGQLNGGSFLPRNVRKKVHNQLLLAHRSRFGHGYAVMIIEETHTHNVWVLQCILQCLHDLQDLADRRTFCNLLLGLSLENYLVETNYLVRLRIATAIQRSVTPGIASHQSIIPELLCIDWFF